MARQKSKKWSDYLWLVSATYFTLGFFNIVFAWLGVICFMIPLFMAVFGWCFDVPWHWAYPVEIEPWKAQFAFGLYGIMLTSLIVGVLLTIFYRPRTWCVFCPMGNMTQLICKLKAR